MPRTYALGKKAKGICDVCGFAYKLSELRAVTRNHHRTGLLSCRECWDSDHPQNDVGRYPVDDPQALRNPRPDHAEYAQSREMVYPVTSVKARGFVGTVTVVT